MKSMSDHPISRRDLMKLLSASAAMHVSSPSLKTRKLSKSNVKRLTGSEKRRVISLDGTWQMAQGDMNTPPAAYDHFAPVPGLVDMAQPAYSEVGYPSAQRQAFWYRRSIHIEGTIPDAAILKVNKAQFGTKIWVNGIDAGEHYGCFTPGIFDISKFLHPDAENIIIIRVGAFKDALPPFVPSGVDGEKFRWQPGIYDSVSLTLCHSPYIERIQAAPHIEDDTVLVEAVIRNAGTNPTKSDIMFSVYETGSGVGASTPMHRALSLEPGQTQTVRVRIHLKDPHLWSPESPFLYTLRCETNEDSLDTRFGMREFRYDVKTGRAILNGRPYLLRGTNFCMFRFFEDPLRDNLPWNRAWVQKLLTMPKSALHWNSARVCIAPFPEFWYDLADEIGWLLQDEFSIWGFNDQWSHEELVSEFTEWIHERCNHPSLVVWDACNETLTPRTGEVISAVRDLDLSHRPWDDGYSQPNRIGDAVEDHPYRFQDPSFKLEDIGSALDRSSGLRKPPVVINEYAWLWINRDGTPTTLTRQLFDTRLGPDATPAQRREFSAYNWAGLTEYWRARRDAAAVQDFCYLTYSEPEGRTCDHFLDVRKLTLDPVYLKFMSSAFSPLAIIIDDFGGQMPAGKHPMRIIITNDLYEPQSGALRLGLTTPSEEKINWGKPVSFTVKELAQHVYEMKLQIPEEIGAHRLIAELKPKEGTPVYCRRNFEIISAEEARRQRDIALGCHAIASSSIHDTRGNFPASFATDGKMSTRWSSEFADPQWLEIDLRKMQTLGRIQLCWENAFGKEYAIQVSDDGNNWHTVYTSDNGTGGVENIHFPAVQARYVRLYGTKRGTDFGYSLWEFRVFE
jgi:hypothetical protein